jgi:hypothetical protein
LLTTLGMLTGQEPVLLTDLPAMPGEDAAGVPRRQVHLAVDGTARDRVTAFFRAQSEQYAPEVVEPVPGGLLVRYPATTPTVTLPAPDTAAEAGTSSRLRVADLRTTGVPEVVEVLGVDGRPIGSLATGGYGTPAGYRSLPPGSYILATRPTADPTAPPVARQAVQVLPGRSYTFALFTAADGTSVNAQFVTDDPPAAPRGFGSVRLVEGAPNPGAVTLAVDDAGGPKAVLADGVSYGLVTGYAQVRAGERTLWLQSGGQEWRLTTRVPSTTAVTLLLTDSPQGPVVHAVPDAPRSAPELGRSGRAEAP